MGKKGLFGAYDARGVYPDEIDEPLARKIARAFARSFRLRTVVLGRDARQSSPSLHEAAAQGFLEEGVQVTDIGLVTTDMMYYAVGALGLDGGVIVSASHNPAQYNGMKIVREQCIPVSGDSGLQEIEALTYGEDFPAAGPTGTVIERSVLADYVEHVLGFIDPAKVKPLQVVANTNFGPASIVLDEVQKRLPIDVIRLNGEIDGSFPKGRPDPLIASNRTETIATTRESGADFAVSWDADADRCFFCTGAGEFIDGCFTTALLAQHLLAREPGQAILFDPRATMSIVHAVQAAGGRPLMTKPGHSFVKERMRNENALFGGELSGHYYFRDNYFADNGMIPFLLMLEMISVQEKTLAELAAPLTSKFFVSGEINIRVPDSAAAYAALEEAYADGALDHTDGTSIDFPDWRFNLRGSNTEPGLIRLNVEATDKSLLDDQTKKLRDLIGGELAE